MISVTCKPFNSTMNGIESGGLLSPLPLDCSSAPVSKPCRNLKLMNHHSIAPMIIQLFEVISKCNGSKASKVFPHVVNRSQRSTKTTPSRKLWKPFSEKRLLKDYLRANLSKYGRRCLNRAPHRSPALLPNFMMILHQKIRFGFHRIGFTKWVQILFL